MLKKIKIKIEGIHCKSCKTLIETEVDVLEGIKDIKVDHQTGEAEIEFDENKISRRRIFAAIEKLNYKINEDASKKQPRHNKGLPKKFVVGYILLALFALGYYLVKRFGAFELLARLNEQEISYWLILLIGFLASFHCVGMCGGLVVAYTAREHAKEKDGLKKNKRAAKAHLQYNSGRFISYTVIGGILGGAGSFFGVNPTFTGVITLLAGGFMILMGLSFLTGFKWLEKVKLKTPDFIARFLYSQRRSKKPKGPLVIGLLNGFMPCGPLQAMQLYALASGSIYRGALSMGIYALGTAPLMFGFGQVISLISQSRIKQMMKISGVVVIILGLFMLNRGLLNFGYGFRSFAPRESTSQTEYFIEGNVKEYQVAKMDLTYRGYQPNVIFIKKDVPVRWLINVKQMSGCTDEIILKEYNIRKPLEYGQNIIEFIPDKLGDLKFSCWMEMVWGKFVVSENEISPEQQKIELEEIAPLPAGTCSGAGSCGGSCGAPACGCSRIREK